MTALMRHDDSTLDSKQDPRTGALDPLCSLRDLTALNALHSNDTAVGCLLLPMADPPTNKHCGLLSKN
jgi:hypothetical protein